MKINKINQNYHNCTAFQSKFSPAVNEYISKMPMSYFNLIDILFEIKNKMTKIYQDEIHYRLPSLKYECSGRRCSCCV